LKGLIKNIQIDFISLVKKGANRKEIIFKSDNAIAKTIEIKKLDEEKRMVYGIVYSPDEVDTQGQYTTASEIEKAAELFMKQGKTVMIDKNHDEQTGQGFIMESWIKKEIDPIFPDEKNGSWVVGIKIENEITWQEITKGEITGLSMQGIAVVEPAAPETLQGEEMHRSCGFEPKSLFEKLKKLFIDFNNYCISGEKQKEEIFHKENAAFLSSDDKITILINKLDEMKLLLDQRIENLEKSAGRTKQITEAAVSPNRSSWRWL